MRNEARQNFCLAGCWIASVIVAVVLAQTNPRLEEVSQEVLKWIGEMLLPICLLVLSRVLGMRITTQFGPLVNRQSVYWLTMTLSLIFIAFAISTIHVAASKNPNGLKMPENHESHEYREYLEYKLHQLEALSTSGTTILVALIWPILSMLLDYLFPKNDPPMAPGNSLGTHGPPAGPGA